MTTKSEGLPTSRRAGKSAAAFRTISEVATELDVPAHVLRFWETKFHSIRPLKRGGGRRYYRPEDIALLRRIRGLLYDDGYTIKGVQRLLRESGGRIGVEEGDARPLNAHGAPIDGAEQGGEARLDPHDRRELDDILGELKRLRSLLKDRRT